MKIGIVADMHLAYTSSILPLFQKDSKYTTRLKYMIDTVKWYEELFAKEKCCYIVNLGDLTDSNILRAEEITALAECYAGRGSNSIPEIYITGNHDTLTDDHRYSATSILNNIPEFTVIDHPTKIELNSTATGEKVNCTFLPYMNWKKIDHEFLKSIHSDILFSHIDIKGSSLYKSFGDEIGIDPELLSPFYNKLFNGHIHLQEKIKCSKDNIWNVGSLTSSSFSDSNNYIPGAHIYDTQTEKFETFPNPYNILFRKFKINTLTEFKKKLSELDKSYRYVIRAEIPFNIKDDAIKLLEKEEQVIANRLILNRKNVILSEDTKANLEIIDKSNIKFKFMDFIKSYTDENDKELKYPVNSYLDLISKI